jgi:hypothetical protein
MILWTRSESVFSPAHTFDSRELFEKLGPEWVQKGTSSHASRAQIAAKRRFHSNTTSCAFLSSLQRRKVVSADTVYQTDPFEVRFYGTPH